VSDDNDLALFREVHQNAVKRLGAVGFDIDKLPVEMKTLLLVHAAQGKINNGGLQYFFENDWPSQPQYSVFSDAYRQIGAHECADMLDRAVALLAIEHPEQHADLRQKRMEELCEQEESEFARLSRRLCVTESDGVWQQLDCFIERNRNVLLEP
jgi:hypothetical protein